MNLNNKEAGLRSFVGKVCLSTLGGITITAGTTALLLSVAELTYGRLVCAGGLVVGWAAVLSICFEPTTYKLLHNEIVPEYSTSQKITYFVLYMSQGVVWAPYLQYLISEHIPIYIPYSRITDVKLLGVAFAAMLLFSPKSRGILRKSKIGIMVGMCTRLTRYYFTKLNPVIYLRDYIFGFSLIYDAYQAIFSFDCEQPDYMKHGMLFYLDCIAPYFRTLIYPVENYCRNNVPLRQ